MTSGTYSETTMMILCGIFAAVTAICSLITIPLGFTPVPVNLGTLSVFLTGGILGKKIRHSQHGGLRPAGRRRCPRFLRIQRRHRSLGRTDGRIYNRIHSGRTDHRPPHGKHREDLRQLQFGERAFGSGEKILSHRFFREKKTHTCSISLRCSHDRRTSLNMLRIGNSTVHVQHIDTALGIAGLMRLISFPAGDALSRSRPPRS